MQKPSSSGATTDTAAASSSDKLVRAAKVDYGQYSIWQDPNADSIGRQVAAPNAAGFDRMQNCLDACDNDKRCAGARIDSVVHPGSNVNDVGPKSCKLIYGDSRQGQFKRTVLRMDTTKVAIPVYMRGERSRMSR